MTKEQIHIYCVEENLGSNCTEQCVQTFLTMCKIAVEMGCPEYNIITHHSYGESTDILRVNEIVDEIFNKDADYWCACN